MKSYPPIPNSDSLKAFRRVESDIDGTDFSTWFNRTYFWFYKLS